MNKKGQSGQGVAEYTMIIILIVVSAILVSRIFGISVYDVYCRVVSVLSPNACSGALCSDKFANLSGEQGVNGTWTTSNGTLCNSGGGYMLNSCSQTNLNTNKITGYRFNSLCITQ